MFLDAINAQRHPPGTVLLLERDAIPLVTDHNKLSPHQVDRCEVLAVAEFRGTLPVETCAVGVVTEVVDIATALSPVVHSGVDACIARVVERLTSRGHTCTRRAHADAPADA